MTGHGIEDRWVANWWAAVKVQRVAVNVWWVAGSEERDEAMEMWEAVKVAGVGLHCL